VQYTSNPIKILEIAFKLPFLTYNTIWNLTIYTTHYIAILPSSLYKHLQSKSLHPKVTKEQRKTAIKQITSLLETTLSWAQIPAFTLLVPIIQGLQLHKDTV
jgi:hypothetical protein